MWSLPPRVDIQRISTSIRLRRPSLMPSPWSDRAGTSFFSAECPDGHGSELFDETMKKYKTPQEVVTAFQREKFRMGVHKAFLWTRSLTKAKVHLYSTLNEELSHRLMTTPVKSIEELFLSLKTKYPRPPKNCGHAKSQFDLR